MDEELSRRFRGRTVFGPFEEVRPDEPEALEAEVGGRLPSGCRAFIEHANGGQLEYDVRVPPGDAGEVLGFTELYRVGTDQHCECGHGTLLGEYRRRNEGWLAEHVATERLPPIKRNGGNDVLFLDLAPETDGRMVAFVHGLSQWTGPTEHDVLATVAETFDAYRDTLFISDETAEMNWEDVRGSAPDDAWRRAIEQWLDEGLPGWRTRSWATRREAGQTGAEVR